MRKLALALFLAGTVAGCRQETPVAPVRVPAPARADVPTPAPLPEGRTPEERRALLRMGLGPDAGRDPRTTLRVLERIIAVDATVGDHALAARARLTEQSGDASRALEAWAELVRRWPDSVHAGEAALALAADRFRRGLRDEAETWLARAARDELRSDVRARALGLQRESARAAGDVRRARILAEELRSRYRGTDAAREAAEAAWEERATVALATIGSAREEISRRLDEGDPSRALELAHETLQRFAGDGDIAEVHFLRAKALGRTGAGEEAIAALEAIRRAYPTHPAAAASLYRLAAGAWNQDDDEKALGLFSEYRRRHPHGAQSAQALYAIGRIHQEARRWDVAGATFARLAREHRSSELAAEAAWRVGWCHYRAGEHRTAAKAFADVAARGLEVPASRYWRARSLERAATSRSVVDAAYAEILRRHPTSYYSFRSEQRLGRPIGEGLRAKVRPERARPIRAPAPNVHWDRYEVLRLAELEAPARLELEAYESSVSLGRSRAAELIPAWQAVDGWSKAIRIALRAGGCEIESADVRACYPFGYGPLLESQASRRGLDPFLVAALIRQESLYDARARSPADARGLMQLLPSTAERVARGMGAPPPSIDDLYRPEVNVPLGTEYLAGLLERYARSPVLALAGYNAGERAVAKWQDRYPGLAEDEFVESISYGETRDYVKKVLQNRRVYAALYE